MGGRVDLGEVRKDPQTRVGDDSVKIQESKAHYIHKGALEKNQRLKAMTCHFSVVTWGTSHPDWIDKNKLECSFTVIETKSTHKKMVQKV